jgi:YVTN family beta-propeller protein
MKPLFTWTPVLSALAVLMAGCSALSSKAPAVSTTESTQSRPAATAQVQRQAVAPALYEIAFSAKQNAVFVASAGGRGPDAPPPRIFRLDPKTLAVVAEIRLERPGLGLAIDDDANRLYVGNAFDASVTVVDTRTNQVSTVVQLAQKVKMKDFDGKDTERYPHNLRELVLDKANQRLFAPGIWITDSALYVVDTDKLALEKVLPGFGFGTAGVTLDATASKLFVSNMQGQVHVLDSRTLAREKVLEVQADQLLNLAFDRKKGVVVATDHGADGPNTVRQKFAKLEYTLRGPGSRVAVIHPADGKVVHYIDTGKNPVAPLIDEQRHRLFVTNRGSGTVSVHDTRDYRLLQTVQLPSHPNSLALNPATGEVFVTIKNGEKDPKDGSESVARIAL